MKSYRITSEMGQDLGVYEARSPELAIEEMAKAAGYESAAAAQAATSPEELDWLILGLDYVGADGRSITGLYVAEEAVS